MIILTIGTEKEILKELDQVVISAKQRKSGSGRSFKMSYLNKIGTLVVLTFLHCNGSAVAKEIPDYVQNGDLFLESCALKLKNPNMKLDTLIHQFNFEKIGKECFWFQDPTLSRRKNNPQKIAMSRVVSFCRSQWGVC